MKGLTTTPNFSSEMPGRPRRTAATTAQRVLLITGMSGAGKTSALKALEDLGYEAIDNVPLSLLSHLMLPRKENGAGLDRSIAIGVDVRTRDFGVEPFVREIDRLVAERGAEVKLVFLDCDDEALYRRYTVTRHRHPLALDRPVSDGIARERRLIFSLRGRADMVVDTTALGPGELKRILEGHFGLDVEPGLLVFVISFSFRFGLPREADLVLDVRFLANPHYDPNLGPLTGLDTPVATFVAKDDGFEPFFESLTGLLGPLLPRYAAEGKSYLTIAVGCTGGRHRSVFVAERLAAWLRDQGQRLSVDHRDLKRSNG
jgi:RNase adapter protein RapZ